MQYVTGHFEKDCLVTTIVCELTSYATENAHVNHQVFGDDLSGNSLEPNKIRKARPEEMGELAKHG